MMIPKEHAVSSQVRQRRGVGLVHEVRPHAIPDDNDHVFGFALGECQSGYEQARENQKKLRRHNNQLIVSAIR